MGYAATAAAAAQPEGHDVERGNVGAGTGAAIGRGTVQRGSGHSLPHPGKRRWSWAPWRSSTRWDCRWAHRRRADGAAATSRAAEGSRHEPAAGIAAPAAQHHPRRRRHECRPGQGGLQADRLGGPCRTGPGVESKPHPGRRGHRVLPWPRAPSRWTAAPRRPGRSASLPCRARQPTSSGWPSWTGSRGRRQ